MLRHLVISAAALGFAAVGLPAADSTDTTGTPDYTISSTDTVSDHQFAQQAASGGMYEVKAAQLALKKGVTGDLATFARMMVDDHQKANQELEKLAGRKGIDLPKDLAKEHQSLYDRLAKLDGKDFARTYYQQQVKAHDDTIALFEREVADGKDGDLKQFAEKTLPTLRHHRDELSRMQEAMGDTMK